MIRYRKGLQTRDVYQCARPEYENICKQLQCCFEVLEPEKKSLMYFDIDVKSNELIEEQFLINDQNILKSCTELLQSFFTSCTIQSICTCSAYLYINHQTFETLCKHSFHFVMDVEVDRRQNKKLAEELNTILLMNSGQPALFDVNVYHTMQVWRSVYATKPEERRYKKIVQGTFENSLITITSDEVPKYVVQATDNETLLRIEEHCQHGVFAEEYECWIQYGLAVAWLVKQQLISFARGLQSFRKFSELSTVHSVSSDEIYARFQSFVRDVRSDCLHVLQWNHPQHDILTDFSCTIQPITAAEYAVIELFRTPSQRQKIRQRFTSETQLVLFLFNSLHSMTPAEQAYMHDIMEYQQAALQYTSEQYLPYYFTEAHHEELYRQLCGSVGFVYTGCTLPSKKPEKDEQEYLRTMFLQFCAFIDEALGQQMKAVLDPELLLRRPWKVGNVLDSLYCIGSCVPLYKNQYPYYSTLRQLYLDAHRDASNEACAKNLFTLLVNRACEKIFVCERTYHILTTISNDYEAAILVSELYPFWMLSHSSPDLYVFDDSTGLYVTDVHCQQLLITRLSNLLYVPGKGKKNNNYGLYNDMLKKVHTRLPSLVIVHRSKAMFEQMKHSSIGKLLFPNGFWEAHSDVFYPCRSVHNPDLYAHIYPLFTNTSIVFFARVTDNFIYRFADDVQPEIDRMKNVLFLQMHGTEVAEYHMEALACALVGEKHKGFYVHVGETNSGKSTEKALLESTFGEYVGTGNTEDFAIIKDDRRESAVANSLAYENWARRLLLFSEKAERTLNTEMLKSYASGGEDKIRARALYKTAVVVDIHFTMFFYINEPFKVTSPNDAAYVDRARFIYWNKSFVPEEELKDPFTQIALNPEVAAWKNDPIRRQIYCHLILQAFRQYKNRGQRLPVPPSVRMSTNEEVGQVYTGEDVVEKMMYGFIIDGQSSSISRRSEIEAICTELGLSSRVATMKLNAIIAKLKPANETWNVGSRKKKIMGSAENVWIGVRPRCGLATSELAYLTDVNQWKDLMVKGHGKIEKDVMDELEYVTKNLHVMHLDHPKLEFASAKQLQVISKRRRF